jgi:hypothetical protein
MFSWLRGGGGGGEASSLPVKALGSPVLLSSPRNGNGRDGISVNGNVVLTDGSAAKIPEVAEVERTAYVPMDFTKNKVHEVVSDLEKLKLRYETHVEGLKVFYEEAIDKTKDHYEKHILDLKAKALQHVNLERLIRNDIELDLGNKLKASEKTVDELRDSLAELNRETQEKIRGLRRELDSSNKVNDELTKSMYRITSNNTFLNALSQATATLNLKKHEEISKCKEDQLRLEIDYLKRELDASQFSLANLETNMVVANEQISVLQNKLSESESLSRTFWAEQEQYKNEIAIKQFVDQSVDSACSGIMSVELRIAKKRLAQTESDLKQQLTGTVDEKEKIAAELNSVAQRSQLSIQQFVVNQAQLSNELVSAVVNQVVESMMHNLERSEIDSEHSRSMEASRLQHEKASEAALAKLLDQQRQNLTDSHTRELAGLQENLRAMEEENKSLRLKLDNRQISAGANALVLTAVDAGAKLVQEKAYVAENEAIAAKFAHEIELLQSEIATLQQNSSKLAALPLPTQAVPAVEVLLESSVQAPARAPAEKNFDSTVGTAVAVASDNISNREEVMKLETELIRLHAIIKELESRLSAAEALPAFVAEPLVPIDSRADEQYNQEIAALGEEIIKYDEELRSLRAESVELKEQITVMTVQKKAKKLEIKQWVQQFREQNNRAPDKDDKEEIQETFQEYQVANDALAQCVEKSSQLAQAEVQAESRLASAKVAFSRLKKMRGDGGGTDDDWHKTGTGSGAKAAVSSEAIEELEDQIFALQEELALEKNKTAEAQEETGIFREKLDRMVKEKRSDVVKQFEEEIMNLSMKLQQQQDTVAELSALKTKADNKIKEFKERTELAEAELKRRDEREMNALAPGDEKKELKTQVNKQREEIVLKTKAVAAGWDAAASADERLSKDVDEAYSRGLKEGREKNSNAWTALNAAVEVKENRITELLVQLSDMEDKVRNANSATATMKSQLDAAKLEVADTIALFAGDAAAGGGGGGASSADLDAAREALDQAQEELAIANDRNESLSNEMRLLEQKISVYEQLVSQRSSGPTGMETVSVPSGNPAQSRSADPADVDTCAAVIFAVKQSCAKVPLLLQIMEISVY